MAKKRKYLLSDSDESSDEEVIPRKATRDDATYLTRGIVNRLSDDHCSSTSDSQRSSSSSESMDTNTVLKKENSNLAPSSKERNRFTISDSETSSDEEENQAPKKNPSNVKQTLTKKQKKSALDQQVKDAKLNSKKKPKSANVEVLPAAEKPSTVDRNSTKDVKPKLSKKSSDVPVVEETVPLWMNPETGKFELNKKVTEIVSETVPKTVPKTIPETVLETVKVKTVKVKRQPIVRMTRLPSVESPGANRVEKIRGSTPERTNSVVSKLTPKIGRSKWKAPRFSNSKSTRNNKPTQNEPTQDKSQTPKRLGFGLSRPQNSPQIVKFLQKET